MGLPAGGEAEGKEPPRGGLVPTPEGQMRPPRRGHRGPGEIESSARSRDRDAERAEELNRDRNAERDARNRLVEAQVHRRNDQPEEHDRPPLPRIESRPPGAGEDQQDASAEYHSKEDGPGRAEECEGMPGDGRPQLDRSD